VPPDVRDMWREFQVNEFNIEVVLLCLNFFTSL
ncbi:hypothetical protein M8044_000557, partial [Columbia Basin potato purple top phytoplasma]|nr:hypothetical protein [Columbia Basin potato purple top phytoplasma]